MSVTQLACPRCGVQIVLNTWSAVVTCPRCLAPIAVQQAVVRQPLPVIPLEHDVRGDLIASRVASFLLVLVLVIGITLACWWFSTSSPSTGALEKFLKKPFVVLGALVAMTVCLIVASILFAKSRRSLEGARAVGETESVTRRRGEALAAASVVSITMGSLLMVLSAILLIILGIYLLIEGICGGWFKGL